MSDPDPKHPSVYDPPSEKDKGGYLSYGDEESDTDYMLKAAGFYNTTAKERINNCEGRWDSSCGPEFISDETYIKETTRDILELSERE